MIAKTIAVFLIIKCFLFLIANVPLIARYKRAKDIIPALMLAVADVVVFVMALRYLVTGNL